MDAAADCSDVCRALANADLPAYVSYLVELFAGFDAIRTSDTTMIVLRTSDARQTYSEYRFKDRP